MTAKLRHVALSVPDPQKAAAFYEKALGMTRVGENDHPGATAVYLTDGLMNIALLRYKTEEAAGGDPDKFGVHHFGFVVDDPDAAYADQRQLVDTFEAGADAPWSLDDRDGDYIAGMIRAIVNFRIPISRIEGKFKLSQNRDGRDRAAVTDALSKSDNPDDRRTAELMRSRE